MMFSTKQRGAIRQRPARSWPPMIETTELVPALAGAHGEPCGVEPGAAGGGDQVGGQCLELGLRA